MSMIDTSTTANTPGGLGRIGPSVDARNRNYLLARTPEVQATPPVGRRYWGSQVWLNQEQTAECVSYSTSHYLCDDPAPTHTTPPIPPEQFYVECTQADGFQHSTDPEELDQEGTTVHAAAIVATNHGLLKSYLWAYDADTIVRTLLTLGPVVVGTDWYSQMFAPGRDGLLTVGGSIAGGHAYKLDGVNTWWNGGVVRIKNSWGQGWGIQGYAFLRIQDLGFLMENMGEACLAVKKAA